MRNIILLLAGIALAGCGGSFFELKRSDQSELVYQVSPAKDGGTGLAVDLWFRGSPSGTTTLLLPHTWANQKDLEQGISKLTVLTEGAGLKATEQPDRYEVTHAPSAILHIHYTLLQYWDQPLSSRVYYRPILQQAYFHFLGHAAWVVPDWERDNPVEIRVGWENFPSDWRIANSFASSDSEQVIRAPIRDFLHAVYLGGDFSIHRLKIHGQPVYLAQRGRWQFKLQDLLKIIETTVNTEREFWNDFEFPYFLVTLLPLNDTCCSTGGTGLYQSLALFVSQEQKNLREFKTLIAHEYFHIWNGKKIRLGDPEELQYWFSEGVTNYYMRLLNLRNELFKLNEYVDDYNKVIKEYYTSPVRNARNTELVEGFWKNRFLEKLPYYRGDILSHNINATLKTETTHSFDDAMKNLLTAANIEGAKVSAENLNRAFNSLLPRGIKNEIQKYIEDGQTLEPSPNALGPCVTLASRKLHRFDLGFDFERSKAKKYVVDLNQNSAAYKSGLRNGQSLLKGSVYWGKTEEPVELLVQERGSQPKWVRYFPQGDTMEVPQYLLDEKKYSTDPMSCLVWFR